MWDRIDSVVIVIVVVVVAAFSLYVVLVAEWLPHRH
jgi:hypothetical protein